MFPSWVRITSRSSSSPMAWLPTKLTRRTSTFAFSWIRNQTSTSEGELRFSS
jgi:hypothetical protein